MLNIAIIKARQDKQIRQRIHLLKGKDGELERQGQGPVVQQRETRHTARQRKRERMPTVKRRGDSLDTAELVSGVSLLI